MSGIEILILALAFAVGVVAYCFVKLTQINDERQQREPQGASSVAPPQSSVWDGFEDAFWDYEASIQTWMTESELVEWRNL